MLTDPTTATVLEVAAARIAALDASAWAQGSTVTPGWRECTTLIDAATDDLESSSFGHLSFSVYIEDAPAEEVRYQGQHCASVEPVLVVIFAYRLRAASQVADQRAAWGAASQVAAALCPDWSTQVEATAGTTMARVFSRIENLGRASLLADGSWLRVRQSYRLTYDVPIGVAPTAPTNLTIPTIVGTRGDGDTVTFTSGTWSGTGPISFAYRVLLDGVEVATTTSWTDDATTILQTLVVEVTASNGTAPDGVAESQPLAGTPPSVAWRSFGKIALATAPTLYDPNGILTGTPTIAADGTVTWPMATGQTRSLPSTGAMLVVPAPNILGDLAAQFPWLWAILRAQLVSGPYTSAPIVAGCVLMTTADPTTARGVGVVVSVEAGSTDTTVSRVEAGGVPGAWALGTFGASNGVGAGEYGVLRRTPTAQTSVWAACNGATVSTSGGSSGAPNLSLMSFSAGAWLGLWVGTTASDLIAGSYGTRGLAAITDVDPADFEGVA